MASGFKFLLLAPQLSGLAWGFDRALFGRMVRYSLPMVVIGFAGIINEMLDRVLLKYLLPYDDQTNMKMLGIYSACYKLSILMSLFIQAFRYAAEPFFFAYAGKSDARKVYAVVLKFFVIFCVFIFLLVTLFIDFFKYFVGDEFRAGLEVVPILLLANLCLGIYVNLSIWYKLTDRTLMGALVSLAGAALTIALNIWWIPLFGYVGSAWATLGLLRQHGYRLVSVGAKILSGGLRCQTRDRLYRTRHRLVFCSRTIVDDYRLAAVAIGQCINAALCADYRCYAKAVSSVG